MRFNMKMFDSEYSFAVNRSIGYESILMHNHTFVEIVYVENGSATQKLGTDAIELKKGDLFVIADDTEHSIRPLCQESQFQIINIIFEKNFIDVDFSAFKPNELVHYAEHSDTVKAIHKCLEEYEAKKPQFDMRIRGYIYFILADVLGAIAERKNNSTAKDKSRNDYVYQTTKFIHEHYHEKLRLETIAANVAITSGYLQRLFREERHTSVVEYLLRYRVEQACRLLLETDMSIQEISLSIGFSDVKNFHYKFKKMFGVTPNEYRKIHKGEEK